ncbi:hypothetical protein EVAR_37527_1 [Eumeta japonica]|uniref:Uncharacterized protein n=1 Tax=Eumeta variegata TaxID=151549 RepID=A0A4C1X9K3_EUMVA|nr:hypothetical protein EVAR_37527_1 [Eumeta japonica]
MKLVNLQWLTPSSVSEVTVENLEDDEKIIVTHLNCVRNREIWYADSCHRCYRVIKHRNSGRTGGRKEEEEEEEGGTEVGGARENNFKTTRL